MEPILRRSVAVGRKHGLACAVILLAVIWSQAVACANTTASLAPATYGAECAFYDETPAPRIGQAVFGKAKVPSIVFDEQMLVSRSRPYTPLAYVLVTGDRSRYLFVSHNGTIFNLNGNSFTLLGGSSLTNDEIEKGVAKYLKDTGKIGELAVSKCFSRPWDGHYPDGSHA